MKNKPEWTILEWEPEHYELCHLHDDEKYYSIDIRKICCCCEKSPPKYMLFQIKLMGWVVETQGFENGAIFITEDGINYYPNTAYYDDEYDIKLRHYKRVNGL